jgi:hypothetical protein
LGINSKSSCGHHDAFVGPFKHCPTEIADHGGTDGAFVSFALKHHLERNEGIYFKNPLAVNSAITRSARYHHLLKS